MEIEDKYIKFASATEWGKIVRWAKKEGVTLGDWIRLEDDPFLMHMRKYMHPADRGMLFVYFTRPEEPSLEETHKLIVKTINEGHIEKARILASNISGGCDSHTYMMYLWFISKEQE